MERYTNPIWIIAVALSLLSGCTWIVGGVINQASLTEIAIQDHEMYLMGPFNAKSCEQIKKTIDDNPEIKKIVLTASPGSLDDEALFKLGRYIRSQRLNTHLIDQGVIASGGVDLFLAGVHRTMEKGARFGVHAWSNGLKEATDFPRHHPEHQIYADYISDMLGSDSFYWFTINSAPAGAIYWITENEIEKYRLLTGSVLSPSHNKTPFGEDFISERNGILEDS